MTEYPPSGAQMKETYTQISKMIRARMGWTQQELANEVGCAVSTIAILERTPGRFPIRRIRVELLRIRNKFRQ